MFRAMWDDLPQLVGTSTLADTNAGANPLIPHPGQQLGVSKTCIPI
jgi:hypothetical protein